jgi:hypothetical protein
MSSHQNLQTLFSNVIQVILTKISLDYNIPVSELTKKISMPNITNDIESSIQSYCDHLVPPNQIQSIPEKSKKIIKKKVVPTEPIVGDTIVSSNINSILVPDKPKKVLKKKASSTTLAETNASVVTETNDPVTAPADTIVSVITETNNSVTAPTEINVVSEKPKKILKKKAPVDTIASVITETNDLVTAPADTNVVPEKPKKLLKKKASDISSVVTENNVVPEKPKKVLKKAPVVEIIIPEPVSVPIVKDIVEPELVELKLKPKKILLKKSALESKKNVEDPEYGEDLDQADIYESLQTYEEDSLEPQEINGVKYYIDTSGYIYDFESQDLVGKLNHSNDSVILLNDFSPMSE